MGNQISGQHADVLITLTTAPVWLPIFLHEISLDELPQLNAPPGDMSLSGQRPTSSMAGTYELRQRGQLDLTLEINGLWRVHLLYLFSTSRIADYGSI